MPMAHARMASTAPWISPSQKSAQGAYCRIALVRPIMWYYDHFERAGNIQVERRTLSTKEERYDGRDRSPAAASDLDHRGGVRDRPAYRAAFCGRRCRIDIARP